MIAAGFCATAVLAAELVDAELKKGLSPDK